MPGKGYILVIDQGTTGSAALLFDEEGQVVSIADSEITQIYPQPGWVEHDPKEIYRTSLTVAQEALKKAKVSASDVKGRGITNQGETTVVWDRRTGEPVNNAIVWQCRRTASMCEELKQRGWSGLIREKTGLPIDAYFSATKLRWILDRIPEGQRRAQQGDLLFGTIDSWLVWNLTGGAVHITDYSSASRTMLFNIHTLKWDKEILTILAIPEAVLPKVMPSSQVYGETADGLLAGGLDGKFTYAMEGSIFITGAAIQWLRDGLGLIKNAAESEPLARSVSHNDGVFFVPAFVGLGAPYWDMYARGTILGLTRGTTAGHLARATLEAIAYQVRDVVEVMAEEACIQLSLLRVDGGGTANSFLMQFQADMLGVPIQPSSVAETTSLGAAYLAGLAGGMWKDNAELATMWVAPK